MNNNIYEITNNYVSIYTEIIYKIYFIYLIYIIYYLVNILKNRYIRYNKNKLFLENYIKN